MRWLATLIFFAVTVVPSPMAWAQAPPPAESDAWAPSNAGDAVDADDSVDAADSADAGAEAEASEPLLVAGVILTGSGILAVVVGATLGTIAAAQYGSIDCPEDTCSPELFDDADSYNDLRVPSGITIAAGGIMSAIGGAFLYAVLTDPDRTAAAQTVSLELSPSSFGIRGRF